MIRSFRLQVTAWYVAFISALLIVFSLLVYGVLTRSLQSRLDETLSTEAQTASALFRSELQEMHGAVEPAASEAVAEMRTRGVLVAIFSEGRLLASSDPGAAQTLRPHLPAQSTETAPERVLTAPGGYGTRVAVHKIDAERRTFLIVCASSLESVSAQLQAARRTLYIALPLLLVLAAAGGFLIADRSLRPLFRITAQAGEIGARNLNRRLDAGRSAEELSTLAATFNELLSRLDASFATMRRFIADASHELRTPVAIIRGEADLALAQIRRPEDYRDSLAAIQDESKRLTRLVDDLLNLARADAGDVLLATGELYLNDLLTECCRSVQSLAGAKRIGVECRAGNDIQFSGDEELLRRMTLNLLDNAIRYTPEGGRILVQLLRDQDRARIVVSDTGIGIAPEAAPHIFERFYRGDQARSRQSGGFGLGLAIVKWIAEAHQGSVRFTSEPGAGATFEVLLPTPADTPVPRNVA